jgi:hypothetical protein
VQPRPRDGLANETSTGDFMTRFLIAACLLTTFLLTATGCTDSARNATPPAGTMALPPPPVGAGSGKQPAQDKSKDKPAAAQ